MISLRDFWRRQRRGIFISAGVVGSGYALYKLYDAHRKKVADLERELAAERERDESDKAHMKANFESVQMVADSATLRHVMNNLSSCLEEVLDIKHLTERLMKGKDQPNTLTSAEKIELWNQVKVLSFTRMVLSLWAMTVLSLYIQVLVNILGRYMYADTAQGSLPEDAGLINTDDQTKFLESADFLSNQGMPTLLSNMQTAAMEVLKGKQLRDAFSKTTLRETIVQILDTFMSTGSPHHWVEYLMPQGRGSSYNMVSSSSSGDAILPDAPKFDQLMLEARLVVSSEEFGSVVDASLTNVTNALLEDFEVEEVGISASSGIPLVKLLFRVAQMDKLLLKEPNQNHFIQVIRDTHEVEVFFTLLYSVPPSENINILVV